MGDSETLKQILGEMHIISDRLGTIEANQNLIHAAVVDQGKRIAVLERARTEQPLYPTPTPQPIGGDGGGS
jgi:DNA-directed RNA polymerase subunit H (RpoH/RPB5)